MLLPPERSSDLLCGYRECCDADFRARAAERAAKWAKRIAEFSRLGEAERSRLAPIEGITDPEAYPITVVPSLGRHLSELPLERLERFAERLMILVKEVWAEGSQRTPDATQVDSVEKNGELTSKHEAATQFLMRSACAICQGKCCSNGGEHAYLSAEAIHRFFARHPDAEPEDVVAAYLEHIPTRAFTDSCVFHGEQGCSLPPDFRAATCGDFYCDGLHDLRNRLGEGAPLRTFFVSADAVRIAATKFVEASNPPMEQSA